MHTALSPMLSSFLITLDPHFQRNSCWCFKGPFPISSKRGSNVSQTLLLVQRLSHLCCSCIVFAVVVEYVLVRHTWHSSR